MLDYRPLVPFRPSSRVISTFSEECLFHSLVGIGNPTLGSNNFPSANLAVFVPFQVSEPTVALKLIHLNGSAVAGNIDLGIYDEVGTLLVSTGSTAQAGTNVRQVIDVTDTTLGIGAYYLALASDTSGATQKCYSMVPAAGLCAFIGLLQMASAFPLPATATFAAYTQAFIPVIEIQVGSVV